MGDTQTAEAAVNRNATGQRGPVGTGGSVSARIADGPLVGPVLRRMVSIVLARADWSLDRLDDALLVCDALSAHAPGHAQAGWLALSVRADEREAELRVGELSCEGASDLVRDATLPLVGNVLEGIAEKVSVQAEQDGGSQLVLVLSAG
jgi:hypothetical protein